MLSLLPGSAGMAVAKDNPVRIGDRIKSLRFKDIRYLTRSLDELGQHKAFVFVFTNTTCPLVQRYLPRLQSLHERFAKQDVQFVAVNVGPSDTIREMASQALEAGVTFPFVKDVDGTCAKALGIERTPQVAVLDGEYRIVYRGRIDDQYRIGGALPKPRRSDLEDSLRALLVGTTIDTPETPVDGCLITFPETESKSQTELTFHKHIAPMLRKHCVECHRPGTAAPFSLRRSRKWWLRRR